MKALTAIFLFMLVLVAFAGDRALVSGSPGAMAVETVPAAAATVAHPGAPKLSVADYPAYRGLNSRLTVWIAAQLH